MENVVDRARNTIRSLERFSAYSGDSGVLVPTLRGLVAEIDRLTAERDEARGMLVWLVDNLEITTDCLTSEPSIIWPGFELVGDMTGDDIVEAVKRAKEASDGQ